MPKGLVYKEADLFLHIYAYPDEDGYKTLTIETWKGLNQTKLELSQRVAEEINQYLTEQFARRRTDGKD